MFIDISSKESPSIVLGFTDTHIIANWKPSDSHRSQLGDPNVFYKRDVISLVGYHFLSPKITCFKR